MALPKIFEFLYFFGDIDIPRMIFYILKFLNALNENWAHGHLQNLPDIFFLRYLKTMANGPHDQAILREWDDSYTFFHGCPFPPDAFIRPKY
eukprot:snap_masked-scaffold_56-processed-gene-1.41-mRNA-1 protein AED:1.00 eAED:1.00 QI:0/0/0/0/1/1/2/0/91